MVVYGAIGRGGSGKTLIMSVEIITNQALGWPTFTNYGLKGQAAAITNSNFENILKPYEGQLLAVGIDEIGGSTKQRNLAAIDLDLIAQQARKLTTEKGVLFYTAQLIEQVPQDLLGLTEIVFDCIGIYDENWNYCGSWVTPNFFSDFYKTFLPLDTQKLTTELTEIFGCFDRYGFVKQLQRGYDDILEKYAAYADLSKKKIEALLLRDGAVSSIAEAGRVANMLKLEIPQKN